MISEWLANGEWRMANSKNGGENPTKTCSSTQHSTTIISISYAAAAIYTCTYHNHTVGRRNDDDDDDDGKRPTATACTSRPDSL